MPQLLSLRLTLKGAAVRSGRMPSPGKRILEMMNRKNLCANDMGRELQMFAETTILPRWCRISSRFFTIHRSYHRTGGFLIFGVPKNGWFLVENHIDKWRMTGGTSISWPPPYWRFNPDNWLCLHHNWLFNHRNWFIRGNPIYNHL